MVDDKICYQCGAQMKKYWHRLTPMLVKVLVKFRTKVMEKDKNVLHIPKDIELSTTEYNNFQKLRLHALVAKYKENGEHKAGYWVLTKRGNEFCKSSTEIPRAVQTFRNEVIGYAEEKVYIKDVIGSTPFLEEKRDFLEHSEPVRHINQDWRVAKKIQKIKDMEEKGQGKLV